jgi:two-component system nitrate/nitrite response regulator NarL
MFKTLLVEDNLNYRRVLKNALLRRFIDLETKEASGESDALDIVGSYDPDLVFMDINLKCGVSGLNLTKVIKLDHPETVVVILSHHDTPEYRSAAQENGADFFFSKSSSLESIYDYVNSVIEQNLEPH